MLLFHILPSCERENCITCVKKTKNPNKIIILSNCQYLMGMAIITIKDQDHMLRIRILAPWIVSMVQLWIYKHCLYNICIMKRFMRYNDDWRVGRQHLCKKNISTYKSLSSQNLLAGIRTSDTFLRICLVRENARGLPGGSNLIQ